MKTAWIALRKGVVGMEGKENQVERCFKVYELLFANVVFGFSNKDIADATNYSAVEVTRALKQLEELGHVEKITGGRYALTVKPLSLVKKYNLHMQGVKEKAEEIDNRANAWARR